MSDEIPLYSLSEPEVLEYVVQKVPQDHLRDNEEQ